MKSFIFSCFCDVFSSKHLLPIALLRLVLGFQHYYILFRLRLSKLYSTLSTSILFLLHYTNVSHSRRNPNPRSSDYEEDYGRSSSGRGYPSRDTRRPESKLDKAKERVKNPSNKDMALMTAFIGGAIALNQASKNPKVREKFSHARERVSESMHKNDRGRSRPNEGRRRPAERRDEA